MRDEPCPVCGSPIVTIKAKGAKAIQDCSACSPNIFHKNPCINEVEVQDCICNKCKHYCGSLILEVHPGKLIKNLPCRSSVGHQGEMCKNFEWA